MIQSHRLIANPSGSLQVWNGPSPPVTGPFMRELIGFVEACTRGPCGVNEPVSCTASSAVFPMPRGIQDVQII